MLSILTADSVVWLYCFYCIQISVTGLFRDMYKALKDVLAVWETEATLWLKEKEKFKSILQSRDRKEEWCMGVWKLLLF